MHALKAMFSSATDEWPTPAYLFEVLNEHYGPFDCDVCATAENAKCEKFFTSAQNGLLQPWERSNWMNPPYGRQIAQWVRKAHDEARHGNLTTALLPARIDTKWFHQYIYRKHAWWPIRGRIKFGEAENSAPFGSIVVHFVPWENGIDDVIALGRSLDRNVAVSKLSYPAECVEHAIAAQRR
jgi:site-specific DNA-methyltransferase (adenine-specific)